MKVNVQFFARARDRAGPGRVELDVPAPARVAELKQSLGEKFPRVSPLLPNLLVAVGTDYADDRTELSPGSEIACFPPVSGG